LPHGLLGQFGAVDEDGVVHLREQPCGRQVDGTCSRALRLLAFRHHDELVVPQAAHDTAFGRKTFHHLPVFQLEARAVQQVSGLVQLAARHVGLVPDAFAGKAQAVCNLAGLRHQQGVVNSAKTRKVMALMRGLRWWVLRCVQVLVARAVNVSFFAAAPSLPFSSMLRSSRSSVWFATRLTKVRSTGPEALTS